MEFIFMMMAAVATVMIFMVLFSELYKDNSIEKKRIIAEDYASSLQNEFILAAQSHSGYYRVFSVPENLEGYPYEARISGNYIAMNYSDNIKYLPIPAALGQIQKGTNIIRNQNGSICVNC